MEGFEGRDRSTDTDIHTWEYKIHTNRSVKVQKCGLTSPEKFPQAIEMPVKEKFLPGWKIPVGNNLLNNDVLTQKKKCKSPKIRTTSVFSRKNFQLAGNTRRK